MQPHTESLHMEHKYCLLSPLPRPRKSLLTDQQADCLYSAAAQSSPSLKQDPAGLVQIDHEITGY